MRLFSVLSFFLSLAGAFLAASHCHRAGSAHGEGACRWQKFIGNGSQSLLYIGCFYTLLFGMGGLLSDGLLSYSIYVPGMLEVH